MTDELSSAATKLLVAIALVVTVAAIPMLASARPANAVPVMSASQSQAGALSNPTAPAWNDASIATVPMASAPSTVPDANDTTITRVNVQSARTGQTLYLRLSWTDATKDGNVTPSQYEAPQIDSYGDAAAVQLPANASLEPGIAMGSPQALVNVWWWNGAMGSQELLAAGPGTTTLFNETAVSANGTYQDGRWYVVFSRNLSAVEDNRTSFETESDVNVAFAVWNGSNAERAGRKSVSEWYYFPFGPEAQGPPFQTVLWTVAGLAIVVVVAVTAVAVQRGGGG